MRAGAASSPPVESRDRRRWLRDRERQIEAFEECRSSQAEDRDRHAAPTTTSDPNGTTNCPTAVEPGRLNADAELFLVKVGLLTAFTHYSLLG